MECPYCQTENREDRETCYICGKDISTIRLVVNKAREHYNDALEHAERGRLTEAVDELKHATDLDAGLVNAHVVLGTLYARQGKFKEARDSWNRALALNPEMARAHDYLQRVDNVQAVLPTLKTYRWVSAALLIVGVALAAMLIYALRPDPGAAPLRLANQLIEQREFGAAVAQLEQARILSDQDSVVRVSADALAHTLQFDLQQRIRTIQDLKYRQLFPEALEAIAELETLRPDAETSVALSTIRSDISYYYYSMISQLYAAYEQGDLDYEILEDEIVRFINLYPASPDRDEILNYLARAQRIEVQTAMDEVRRRFSMTNNVETAVQDLRDLTPRYADLPSFQTERSAFIEEILSVQFNMFTNFLDQAEFVRAAALLRDVERVTSEFQDVIEVDVSGAVDLAWSVLRDARRQYQLDEMERLISIGEYMAAEEAMYEMLNEEGLSEAEYGLLLSYWRRINREEELAEFYETKPSDQDYFQQRLPDDQASRTLRLYNEMSDMALSEEQRHYLAGLAAASAVKLGDVDLGTSLSAVLRTSDARSSVTRAVRTMIRKKIEETEKEVQPPSREQRIRIEPVNPKDESTNDSNS